MVVYLTSIPVSLKSGFSIRIQGCADIEGDRFDINLQSGSQTDCPTIPFHFSVRFEEGTIVRNSRRHLGWEDELTDGPLLIGKGQLFDILIKVEPDEYIIEVDGQYFCEFPHRIPVGTVNHIQVSGDVQVNRITIQSGTSEYFYLQMEGTNLILPMLYTGEISSGLEAAAF
ncbi:hypothetical protein GWI33_007745 [Rhynchophorus ferrugineus]|uniref:Galectin n=1 Tax=Rhynchophorus ferrugineus TaxID=354439 RepID=A0A834MKS2_RHYFE|nr:hypothetical protein GWI33_007745 [Rhynchophorus ferrugineus]